MDDGHFSYVTQLTKNYHSHPDSWIHSYTQYFEMKISNTLDEVYIFLAMFSLIYFLLQNSQNFST